jgi:pimeloyl-ACP methyl ester carboxylesterase
VNGNHDVIVYAVSLLFLVQNMANAKLVLYPAANHGSWYQNHEDFVFEADRFLAGYGATAETSVKAQSTSQ